MKNWRMAISGSPPSLFPLCPFSTLTSSWWFGPCWFVQWPTARSGWAFLEVELFLCHSGFQIQETSPSAVGILWIRIWLWEVSQVEAEEPAGDHSQQGEEVLQKLEVLPHCIHEPGEIAKVYPLLCLERKFSFWQPTFQLIEVALLS